MLHSPMLLRRDSSPCTCMHIRKGATSPWIIFRPDECGCVQQSNGYLQLLLPSNSCTLVLCSVLPVLTAMVEAQTASCCPDEHTSAPAVGLLTYDHAMALLPAVGSALLCRVGCSTPDCTGVSGVKPDPSLLSRLSQTLRHYTSVSLITPVS